MSMQERQRQFETTVTSFPGISPEARLARNFGFSNSARVIEGGLFACTSNLEGYSAKLAAGTTSAFKQFVFLCVLTFPPQDEVYFAIVVSAEADKVSKGLIKLFGEATARNEAAQREYDEVKRLYDEAVAAGRPAKKPKEIKPESISNNVKFYITADGRA
jgi:5-methylcytosine-specific restriction protein B